MFCSLFVLTLDDPPRASNSHRLFMTHTMTYFKVQAHVIKSNDLEWSEHNQNTRFQSAILLGDASTALLESARRPFTLLLSWRRLRGATTERSSGGSSVRDLVLVVLQHVVRLAPVRDESIAASSTTVYLTGQGSAQDLLGDFFLSYLLLRKQLCMTLIMNAAASFSLIWGLNLPLLRVNQWDYQWLPPGKHLVRLCKSSCWIWSNTYWACSIFNEGKVVIFPLAFRLQANLTQIRFLFKSDFQGWLSTLF